MIPLICRAVIMYIVVIFGVRFMGKRQIGELQPAELVITILLSDIASMPLMDNNTPLLQSVMMILILISLELLSSVVSIKSRTFRLLLQGHSVMVINKGEIDQKQLKQIRYSVDDIMEAMRLKDCFDVSEIEYAYIETNGEMSIKTKDETTEEQDLPCLVISDGKLIDREFDICNLTKQKLENILNEKNLKRQDIFLMTYTADGQINIIMKKEN